MTLTAEPIVHIPPRDDRLVSARQRGAVLAAFAEAGLPAAAVPDVVEALEAGDVPEEVAGAALALTGLARPVPRIAASLQRAIDNRAGIDAVVSIGDLPPTTVLAELVRAVGRLAARDPVAAEVLDDLHGERGRYAPEVRALIAATRPGTVSPQAA